MKDLKGKVAFVTGGSSGIGQGIVKVLAAEGMKVAFSYRRQDHLDQTMAYFRDKPQQAVHPIKVHGPMEQATFSDWDWIMSINVGGVINALVTFLPGMVANGMEAHIVNVASMGGIAALGAVGLYTTTKYAVVGLSESLRTDMMGRNIGVSVYCPGTVKSNIGAGDAMRNERFKDSGYAPPAPRKEGETSFMDFSMDAVEAGRHVLNGIKNNQLFIISHPEYRDVLRARHAKIEASISNEPVDGVRAESVRFILSNAIYSENA